MDTQIEPSDYLANVRKQYEELPFPERDPEDEKKRIKITQTDSVDQINYFCFEGKRNFDKDFRALVAGGGTGDAAIYLAEQLRDSSAEIVCIDLSKVSIEIAKKRAEIRNLNNIKWIHASLLDLPKLKLGKFDYINCTGVLHHLSNPSSGLKSLKSVLKKDGAMGIMVYATYGRTGIHIVRDAIQRLTSNIETTEEKISVAKSVLESLPKTNWFVIGKTGGEDCFKGGDVGIYDMFLHSQETSYTVPELYEWVESCDLTFRCFSLFGGMAEILYSPESYTKDETLLSLAKSMEPKEKHALAELICGKISYHSFYLSKKSFKLPSVEDIDYVPYIPAHIYVDGFYNQINNIANTINPDDKMINMALHSKQISLTRRKYTIGFMKYFDGKRTTGEIFEAIIKEAETQHEPIPEKSDLLEEFTIFFKSLELYDWLYLKDKSVKTGKPHSPGRK